MVYEDRCVLLILRRFIVAHIYKYIDRLTAIYGFVRQLDLSGLGGSGTTYPPPCDPVYFWSEHPYWLFTLGPRPGRHLLHFGLALMSAPSFLHPQMPV